MSASEYDSIMETLRIHENLYLHEKILKGMREAGIDRVSEHDLIPVDEEEVALAWGLDRPGLGGLPVLADGQGRPQAPEPSGRGGLPHPLEGVGKPEPLCGDMEWLWSRRIDHGYGLVYRPEAGRVVFFSARDHYRKR